MAVPPRITGVFILLPALLMVSAGTLAAEGYERALMRFNAHDYETAIVELKSELQVSPDNLSALLLLGRAYLATGYGAAAEQALQQARSAGAADSLTLLPLGRAYLQQEKYDALVQDLSPGTLPDPQRAELLTLQGEALVAQQRFDDATARFEQALRADVLSAAPWRGQARLAMARGSVNVAAAHIAKAILLGSRDEHTWFLDGELKRMDGRLGEAVAAYDQALSLAPRLSRARVARAATLIDLGRRSDAEQDIQAVLRVTPHQPQALYLRAMLLARDGKLDEAAAVLDDASAFIDKASPELLRNNAPLLLLAGVVASARGNGELARGRLERLLELEPGHVRAREVLGAVLLRLGEPERAVAVLRGGSGAGVSGSGLDAGLGVAYRQMGNYPEAVTAFERALAASDDSVRLRIELARTRFAAGQRRQALSELAAVAALRDPLAASAGVLLARLQLGSGEPDEALRAAAAVLQAGGAQLPALLVQGDAYLAKRDADAAIGAFERALALAPADLAPRYGIAGAHLAAGRRQMARAQYEAILERSPAQIPAMLGLARVAEADADPGQAVRWLEKARATRRDSVPAHLALVELHLRQGNASEALAAARRFKESVKEGAAADLALGRAQRAAGEQDAARKTYAEAAARPELSAEALTEVARAQVQLRDTDAARATLNAAIVRQGAQLPAQALLVALDLLVGDTRAALERAQVLHRRHPQQAQTGLLLGDARAAAGDPRGAVEAYLAAEALQPGAAVQVKLHDARWQAGEREAAVSGLETWLAAHPGSVEARRSLAGAYLALGRLEEAQSLHEALLSELPGDAELVNNLAWLYQSRGDARALAMAERAVALTPRDAAALDTYGWILLETGQPEAALKVLRQAQALAPQEPWVRFHTAQALARLGRNGEARDLLHSLTAANVEFPRRDDARKLLQQLSGG